MDNPEVILDIRGLTKEFPGVRALCEVSFQVRRGSVHALVGENGAGKSTLIKILTGVYQATSGDFLFKGKKVRVEKPLDAQRLGLSVVHQELKLVETLTIAENIFLGRPQSSKSGLVNWSAMRREAKKLIDELHIKLDVDEEVSRLSIAQKQIVEICKALSFRADLIIMDEPSATLTENELECLFDIIANLKERGITVIYISHRMDEIFKIADTVSVLRDGAHIRTLPISEVDREQLISLMVGRELGNEYPKLPAEITDVALEVRGLAREGVLQDINMHVRHGEIVGFAGLVGAGRTETARAIFAADRITSGQIFVNGKEVHFNSVRDAIRHRIAFVSEDRKQQGLVLGMSVKHNVSLVDLDNVCVKGLMNERRERELAWTMIKKLAISTPNEEKETRLLSGGNQQKVVLAKWLAVDSDIMIMDEPTRGIDVGAKAEIYKLMCQMAQQGKAVIMISSDMPELIGVCDRIYVMRDGTISGEIARENFSQEAILNIAIA
ncbi:MAG: sugar ABC transporter ATP-binding protein [Clostridiales bacterium]|nr:sugar ABC transporter ATP-binding protein [Clostridiales bacterium]OPZ70300.1 MAG: Ribose import ATP-binding protein RbsA [Firmicutes bacterium ADurb.Bin467]